LRYANNKKKIKQVKEIEVTVEDHLLYYGRVLVLFNISKHIDMKTLKVFFQIRDEKLNKILN